MEVVAHPYLEGVLCRSDGAIFVPSGGSGPSSHWTFGSPNRAGYLQVGIARKRYLVNRLICEAFHGLCPADKPETDHLDRNPMNNAADNLRWIDRKGNALNRKICDESRTKYGISQTVDKVAYDRAYYANNPEAYEKKLAHDRAYRAKKKGKGK